MPKPPRFHLCKHCGNLTELIEDKGPPLSCCGENMSELAANTVEASVEKHLPAATLEGDILRVKIGSAPHPMEAAHHIAFVQVQTESGCQRKSLPVGGEPKADFRFLGDKPVAVYAYCNLHGLWKTDMP